MDKFYHWAMRNQNIATILSSVILCTVYSALFILLEVSVTVIVIIDLFLVWISYFYFRNGILAPLQKKAMVALYDYCDPVFFRQEMDLLLSRNTAKVNRQILQMSYSVALISMGEYQEALDLLNSINIDKYAGMLPVNKIVYYNNLVSACTDLGDYDQANLWHTKVMQMYSDLKNAKQKQLLEPAITTLKAWDHYRKQEYEQAIRILDGVAEKNLYVKVSNALFRGKIWLALNEMEQAKSALMYVVQNGNRLYGVVEARKLLETLQPQQN